MASAKSTSCIQPDICESWFSTRQVEVEVRSGLLVVCPLTLPDTDREIGLTMRRNWHPTQMQNRFLEIIEQLVK